MVVIYCRRSNKDLERETSTAVQREKGVAFANRLGLPYTVLTDAGVSGTHDEVEDRPEFAKMMDAIRKNLVSHVWVYDQSRLERSPKIWHIFQHLVVLKGIKYFPNGVETDLNDPQTQLTTGVISLTNRMFAQLTSKKLKDTKAKLVAAGRANGINPYGYTTDENGMLVLDDVESEVVRRLYQMSLDGLGAYTIANVLNDEGIPTKSKNFKGKSFYRKDDYTKDVKEFNRDEVKWRGNVIHDILKNTINKGKKRWNDIFVDAPAIVTEELWGKVNNNFENNKRNAGRNNTYRYLLKGILFCDCCGGQMVGRKRPLAKDTTYKCRHGQATKFGCRGIAMAKIETFVTKHLFESKGLKKFLSSQPSFDSVGEMRKHLKSVELSKDKLEKKQKHIYSLLLDPEFSDDETIKNELINVKRKLENTINEIEEAKIKIEESDSVTKERRFTDAFEAYINDKSFDTIKRGIHNVIEKIQVLHVKESKEGHYLIKICYRGYRQNSVFMTNYQAMDWIWLSETEVGENNSNPEILVDIRNTEHGVKFDYPTLSNTTDKIELLRLKKNKLLKFN
ncbi:MAG: hypothetical protein EOO50_05145 [Flavobacterium sp.]|uniref:recombinase family protein n=1 Tax=Flavobacterium sp. TaxID=239 RepID=UPI00120B20C4|nr:recombinase family protein [Flavobacterium sp.]RZJ67669.1 MAG: hypothetical protein EOO50_05145 [Flavobacterium sp.]